jgi:hypothetical protein
VTPSIAPTATSEPVEASGHLLALPMLGMGGTTDLVVEEVVSEGGQLRLLIVNQGSTTISADFWVDLLIDPPRPPAAPNDTWETLDARGAVWGVTEDLAPGERLTLSLNDRFYRGEVSNFTQPIAAGTPLYAHVDSVNLSTTYGAVLETHERDGLPYNNVRAASAASRISPPAALTGARPPASMPAR